MKRTRQHIKEQVERFRSLGKTDEEIVHWLETVMEKDVSLSSNFDTVEEASEYLGIPRHKFNNFWL